MIIVTRYYVYFKNSLGLLEKHKDYFKNTYGYDSKKEIVDEMIEYNRTYSQVIIVESIEVQSDSF